jgi:hypothetical protein
MGGSLAPSSTWVTLARFLWNTQALVLTSPGAGVMMRSPSAYDTPMRS